MRFFGRIGVDPKADADADGMFNEVSISPGPIPPTAFLCCASPRCPSRGKTLR
jgi:hypothetical protein